MAELIRIDGSAGSGSGQLVRAALSLSVATGLAFEMVGVRPRRARPGLLSGHVAAVRSMAMLCDARVAGAFDGSPELRFEPGPVRGGTFRFEVASAGAATLLSPCAAVALATAGEPSQVEVTGPTHLAGAPPYHYLESHWSGLMKKLGAELRFELRRAGFHPRSGGEHAVRVAAPWSRPASLELEFRGALTGVSGVAGAARLGEEVVRRLQKAAGERLWESRRLEVSWRPASFRSTSPGSFVMLEAEFERGRAAWCLIGERRVTPERLADRAARRLLAFLDGDAAVDAEAADQLAVPLALARGGGRVATPTLTPHLLAVVEVAHRFGVPIRTWGRRGGPGGVEVERC